jgi:WD40 repeat protein
LALRDSNELGAWEEHPMIVVNEAATPTKLGISSPLPRITIDVRRTLLAALLVATACGGDHPKIVAPPVPIVSPPPAVDVAEQAHDAMNRGLDARLDGDHARAKTELLAAHDLAPPNGDALFEAAVEARALGRDDEARALETRAHAELAATAPGETWEIVDETSFLEAGFRIPASVGDHRWVVMGEGPRLLALDPRTERALDFDLPKGAGVELGEFVGMVARGAYAVLSASDDGRLVAVANRTGDDTPFTQARISVVDLRTTERIALLPGGVSLEGYGPSFGFVGMSKVLVSLGAPPAGQEAAFAAYVFDPATRTTRTLLAPKTTMPNDSAYPDGEFRVSADGRRLFAMQARELAVWDLASEKLLFNTDATEFWMDDDGSRVAFERRISAEKDTAISVRELETGHVAMIPAAPDDLGNRLVFHPTNRAIVAVGTGVNHTGNALPAKAAAWDLSGEHPTRLAVVKHDAAADFDGFSKDGSALVIEHTDYDASPAVTTVDSFDWRTGAKVESHTKVAVPNDAPVTSDDGTRTLTLDGGSLALSDHDHHFLCAIPDESGGSGRFAEGGRLVALTTTGQVAFYDARTCAPRWAAPSLASSVSAITFADGGRTIVTEAFGGTRVRWDLAGGGLLVGAAPAWQQTATGIRVSGGMLDHDYPLPVPGNHPPVLASDGGVALAFVDDGVDVWNVRTSKRTAALHGLGGRPWVVRVNADAGVVVAWTGTRVVVWDAHTSTARLVAKGEGLSFERAALSADGRWVAVGGREQHPAAHGKERKPPHPFVRLWDLKNGGAPHVLDDVGGDLTFAPGGRSLVIVGQQNARTLVDTATASMVKLPPLQVATRSIPPAFDEKGGAFALQLEDGIEVFDARTGASLWKLPIHDMQGVDTIALSPDGSYVAVTSGARVTLHPRPSQGGARAPLTLVAEGSGVAGTASTRDAVQLFGDASMATRITRCRLGARSFPISFCQDKLQPGLAAAFAR